MSKHKTWARENTLSLKTTLGDGKVIRTYSALCTRVWYNIVLECTVESIVQFSSQYNLCHIYLYRCMGVCIYMFAALLLYGLGQASSERWHLLYMVGLPHRDKIERRSTELTINTLIPNILGWDVNAAICVFIQGLYYGGVLAVGSISKTISGVVAPRMKCVSSHMVWVIYIFGINPNRSGPSEQNSAG